MDFTWCFCCAAWGGAGSYITSFVADLLRRINILTTAAVVMPFAFEGASRHAGARKGLVLLRKHVDAVFPLSADIEDGKVDEALGLEEAIQQRRTSFGALYSNICYPLLTNQMPGLDFEDMRIVLSQNGQASFRHVVVGNDVPLVQAARKILEKYLKERASDFRPKGLFVSLRLHNRKPKKFWEMNEVMNVAREYMPNDSSILFGSSPNPDEGQAEMTFVFTGG